MSETQQQLLLKGKCNIIGFAGKKQSGRTSCAEFLRSLNPEFCNINFADNLKTAISAILRFTSDQLYGNQKEIVDLYWERSPRWMLQYIGTDLFREKFDPDIWVKSLHRTLLDNEDQDFFTGHDLLIGDVRFKNEVDYIVNNNGIIIHIIRETNHSDYHESEKLDDSIFINAKNRGVYHVINNSSSIEDMYQHLMYIYRTYLNREENK